MVTSRGHDRRAGTRQKVPAFGIGRVYECLFLEGRMSHDQLKRRDLVSLLAGAAVWPFTALAQPSTSRPLIAWMSGLTKPTSAPYFGSFLKGMHDLNYAEGRNFEMVYRFSDGYADRLPVIGEEIVGLKPNVIVATAVDSVIAIRRFTSTIPIVSG